MKKLLYILLFSSSFCFGQEHKYEFIKEITIKKNSKVFTDHLNNIYLIQGNELNKFTQDGEFKVKYVSKILGTLDFIDASNPMKILLFYTDLGQITFLDNTLSENSELLDINQNKNQIRLACNSFNNGFWVYDQENFEIKRYNMNQKNDQKSTNLSQLISEALPNFMREYDNKVYLNLPNRGILVFDLYGTYLSTIPIKNLDKFQIIENKIYYLENKKFIFFDLLTKEINEIKVPVENFEDITITQNRLIAREANKLRIYSVK